MLILIYFFYFYFLFFFFFFFNDTATTEIYTLSLHDALPITALTASPHFSSGTPMTEHSSTGGSSLDRKSTRLNSSHLVISYAVFCLKKKKKKYTSVPFKKKKKKKKTKK